MNFVLSFLSDKVGKKVYLVRRITVEVGHGKFRKDIAKSASGIVRGTCDDGKRVVAGFSVEADGKSVDVDVTIKPTGLMFEPDESTAKTKGKSAVVKKYNFVQADEDDVIQVFENWDKMLADGDEDNELALLKGDIGFVLRRVRDRCPKPTSEDFVVITRNGTPELWTNKDFKKGDIKLVPMATEWRDRYWSQTASVQIANTDKLHPTKLKAMVIDSRLRGTPAEGKLISPFFLVTRSEDKEQVNMKIEYTSLDLSYNLEINGKKRLTMVNASDLPQIPILINTCAVKKGTQLATAVDKDYVGKSPPLLFRNVELNLQHRISF